MPRMPELVLPNWAEEGLTVGLIALLSVIAFVAAHAAIRVAATHLIEARAAEAEGGAMTALELERRLKTLERLAVRVLGALIVVIATLMVLGEFGVEIGPAIAGLGVAGIAVGFGAQSLVKDWLSGIFIVLENQFSQGDVVQIAGVSGVVEEFSLRRTVLRDLDGTIHSVPNGEIKVASNMTRVWARVNLDVSVAYSTDIDRASAVIDRIGEELARDPEWKGRILEAPKVLRVDALGDSGVSIKVLGDVRAAEQWAVTGELRKRLLAAFADAGIEIPFPHRVIVNRTESEDGDGADA